LASQTQVVEGEQQWLQGHWRGITFPAFKQLPDQAGRHVMRVCCNGFCWRHSGWVLPSCISCLHWSADKAFLLSSWIDNCAGGCSALTTCSTLHCSWTLTATPGVPGGPTKWTLWVLSH